VLFAGDAARATDTMTGEGIGQALESGELAAEAIVAAGASDGAAVAAHYRQALHGSLVADDRLASGLSRVLESPRRTRGAIRVAGSTGWSRRNFVRWMFEDYPRAIALTPRRWHRGVLRGPGAFSRP
jgi:2-polyprenyl-6-methoxyphenol hydroxylase-like FAD-dependent oxidoreductase